ncbi:hypothetical protein [Streptomyces sp. NPDC017988]|uniref:hypothetical protein n=1 Tax=Streptomyces sp. NPDC017988 TaxID=3365025 RepID=UPI00379D9192
MSTHQDTTASDTPAEDARAFTPSAATLERSERARKELEARGVEVSVKTFWWKFEVHLNAEGAALAAEIAPLIGEVVAAFLKEPIGTIVEVYAELRGEWIKQVANGGAVKLVSPWLAPGMLIPVRINDDDKVLFWNVYERASGWSAREKFVGQKTAENPALAKFRDKIYCVYRASSEKHLFWTAYDPDRGGWSPGVQLPGNYASPSSPALAVYKDRLYCVHRGTTGNTLWVTYFDGSRWSSAQQIGSQTTTTGPALAVFEDQLYCVYRGSHDQQLFWTRFDGKSWNGGQPIGSQKTSDGPGLADFEGRLYCVYRGSTDANLFWTSLDGAGWSDGAPTGHSSAQGPGLIAGRDKNGTVSQLMCVYRG